MKEKIYISSFIPTLLLTTFILLCSTLQASQVSIEEAMQKARIFDSNMTQKSGSGLYTKSLNITDEKSFSLALNQKTSDSLNSCYYIFNRGDNEGFIIVSAEDGTSNSVLGYTDSGSFDLNNIPENMKDLLNSYKSQIEYLITNPQQSSLRSQEIEAATTTEVPALLGNNKWDQLYPYNIFCPMDGDEQSLAGCGAIAMAQIMYYHKWPDHGTGTKTYITKRLEKELTVDFENSYYDYDMMLPSYLYGDYSQESVNAVATLIYHAGVACEMIYNKSYGGTSLNKIENAFFNIFKYDKSISFALNGYYSRKEIENILKQELINSRPTLCAAGTASSGAHIFICDGYNKEGYFHFNWGWCGFCNGYYLLTAMDSYPEQFSCSIDMIYGLKKSEENSKIQPLLYNSSYSVSCDEDSTYLTYVTENRTLASDTFDLGFIIEDTTGKKIKDLILRKDIYIKYYTTKAINLSFAKNDTITNIDDGIYNLVYGAAICGESDTLTKIRQPILNTKKLTATIENNKIKAITTNIDSVSLHITKYQEECPIYNDAAILINTEITNSSAINYYNESLVSKELFRNSLQIFVI